MITTFAADHLARAEIRAEDFDAWDREAAASMVERASELPSTARGEVVRESRVMRHASQPITAPVISLIRTMPGADLDRDATLAALVAHRRRTALAQLSVGIDERLVERTVRVLDRVCALIDEWPEPAWSEAVHSRVEMLGAARRSGRARGQQLRAARGTTGPAPDPTGAWDLQHPHDHWFRRARPAITDAALGAAVDGWIAAFGPNYAALATEDWSAEEARAELVADVQLSDEMPTRLDGRVATVVLDTRRGATGIGAELSLRLVRDPEAQFNGTLLAVLPGECWRICASVLPDGSVLPGEGTRRLHASTGPAASATSP